MEVQKPNEPRSTWRTIRAIFWNGGTLPPVDAEPGWQPPKVPLSTLERILFGVILSSIGALLVGIVLLWLPLPDMIAIRYENPNAGLSVHSKYRLLGWAALMLPGAAASPYLVRLRKWLPSSYAHPVTSSNFTRQHRAVRIGTLLSLACLQLFLLMSTMMLFGQAAGETDVPSDVNTVISTSLFSLLFLILFGVVFTTFAPVYFADRPLPNWMEK